MQTAREGDRVQVRYVKRLQNGATASSRAPLEMTIGKDPPRLPGLGLALVGLAPGMNAKVAVPAERAYGLSDPTRVHRWSRKRFPKHAKLGSGKLLRLTNTQGRRRVVRILQATEKMVVVDANHRWAGQGMVLEVELLTILGPTEKSDPAPTKQKVRRHTARNQVGGSRADEVSCRPRRSPRKARALAFDLDHPTLISLREALPGWDIEAVRGGTAGSVASNWDPAAADLLVIAIGEKVSESLGLCRFLAFCTVYSPESSEAEAPTLGGPGHKMNAPLLVLVPPGKDVLVKAALEAGADSCLCLPIHAMDVRKMLTRVLAGNQPGRHTQSCNQPQIEDAWRDEGGEA